MKCTDCQGTGLENDNKVCSNCNGLGYVGVDGMINSNINLEVSEVKEIAKAPILKIKKVAKKLIKK